MDSLFKIKHQFKNKNVLIFGLGLLGGGIEAASFFSKLGANVVVTDLKTKKELTPAIQKLSKYSIKYILGEHNYKSIDKADLIIKNPAIRPDNVFINYAKKENKTILMPTAFFLKNSTCYSIGITGTRGKSTTTHLLYSILKSANLKRKVYLAGNIPGKSALRLFGKVKEGDIVLLELSSWQLNNFGDLKISTNIAALTNIYPDHLNFYKNMDQYVQDKFEIFKYQSSTDQLFVNKSTLSEFPIINSLRKGKLNTFTSKDYKGKLTKKQLIGDHNLENIALASKIAKLLNISPEIIEKAVCNFPGLPYRLQYIGNYNSTPFYNDSTSTTPIACEKAIKAIAKIYPNKKLHLILGGNSKNLPIGDLVVNLNKYAYGIYYLPGSFTDLIKNRVARQVKNYGEYKNLKNLFIALKKFVDSNSVVLFSPSATSFASFLNEFDRAEQFNYYFNKLNY
jgi:UDP-N-acetylmuramoylalanine--D-glutamate ligase